MTMRNSIKRASRDMLTLEKKFRAIGVRSRFATCLTRDARRKSHDRATDESTYKPGSVPTRTSVTAIHLGLSSPTSSSGLPADLGGPPSNICATRVVTNTSLLDLA